MASIRIKTKETTIRILGRNGWQLSDESDEEDGVILPADDLKDDLDEEGEEEEDLKSDKFDEE